jgi:hypothetical protein
LAQVLVLERPGKATTVAPMAAAMVLAGVAALVRRVETVLSAVRAAQVGQEQLPAFPGLLLPMLAVAVAAAIIAQQAARAVRAAARRRLVRAVPVQMARIIPAAVVPVHLVQAGPAQHLAGLAAPASSLHATSVRSAQRAARSQRPVATPSTRSPHRERWRFN